MRCIKHLLNTDQKIWKKADLLKENYSLKTTWRVGKSKANIINFLDNLPFFCRNVQYTWLQPCSNLFNYTWFDLYISIDQHLNRYWNTRFEIPDKRIIKDINIINGTCWVELV